MNAIQSEFTQNRDTFYAVWSADKKRHESTAHHLISNCSLVRTTIN